MTEYLEGTRSRKEKTALREASARYEQVYEQLRLAHEELRRTQTHVIQQERLQALGEMASGIAHDLNNALAPVIGFTELLLNDQCAMGDPVKLKRFLELIHAGASDAAAIVARLRDFYRQRDAGEPLAGLDLNEIVRQALLLAQPKWKDEAQARGVTIEPRTQLGEVPRITGSQVELRQAIVNLIFNAVDAMPGGGTILLRTERAPLGQGQVRLIVSDTGMGMPEPVRLRCLEPFFSTKGEAGTGLGLAMVHGVVRRHGGTITVESQVGAGTTFTLCFPAGGQSADRGRPTRVDAPGLPPLRVLAVDDEPNVRQMLREFLLPDGHAVETAVDGADGWAKFQSGSFDLVITDRAMPNVNGDQLAAAIKGAAPDTPVIMLTGYGELMQARGERPASVDHVLAKPVSLGSLYEAMVYVRRPGSAAAVARNRKRTPACCSG